MDIVVGILVVYSLAITIFATVGTYLMMRHALRLDDLEEEVFRIKHPPKTEWTPIDELGVRVTKLETRAADVEKTVDSVPDLQRQVARLEKNVEIIAANTSSPTI